MSAQNGTRKSLRVKRKSTFLEDYVQSGVQLNDEFKSSDENLSEQSDLDGKYNTYVQLFVQSGPPLISFIAEEQVLEKQDEEIEDESSVNSEMEEVDDPEEEIPL